MIDKEQDFDGVTLYRVGANGSMSFWLVESNMDGLTSRWGQLGGAEQRKDEDIYEGKAGRDTEEQVALRVRSLALKKIDKGYKLSLEQARASKGTNASGLPRPMLAQKIHKYRHPINAFAIQRKYDGHRCIMYNDGEKNRAYSRNGKELLAIRGILNTIEIPEGIFLDGELYVHGVPLQTISSWVKRYQINTSRVRYIVYDLIDEGLNYLERYQVLQNICYGPCARRAHTLFGNDPKLIQEQFRIYREGGYEGAIVRLLEDGYAPGKRSNTLLKVKEFHDDEFVVIGMTPSKDGWAILTCANPHGPSFEVSAPGTIPERTTVMRQKESYIGRSVRVEYPCLTNSGKVFQPVATMWRDKHGE